MRRFYKKGSIRVEEIGAVTARAPRKGVIGRGAVFALVLVGAMIMVSPFGFLILVSLNETWSIFAVLGGAPIEPTLENFRQLLFETVFPRWMLNSLLVTGSIVAITLVTNPLAGYVFSKKRFPGRDFIFWLIMSTQMVPFAITVLPLFFMVKTFHLMNTLWALILPPLGSPIGIFLMRQFIQTIPDELIDAARIDGCSEFGIYLRVILPLSLPGLAVLAVMNALRNWNMFLWPLVVMSRNDLLTWPVGLSTFVELFYANWGRIMAGSLLSIMPLAVLFLLFQKAFVQGLTAGGVKG